MSDKATHITPAETEYLSLADWFSNMLSAWEEKHRPLKEKERKFQAIVERTATGIRLDIAKRALNELEAEQKREKRLNKVTDMCPNCSTTEHCEVTGTAKNKFGHTLRKVHCTACDSNYVDADPINEEDKADWVKQIAKILNKTSNKGEMPEELQSLATTLIEKGSDYLEKKKKADTAKEKLKEANASYQQSIQTLADQLLTMQLDTVNWNKHIGKA